MTAPLLATRDALAEVLLCSSDSRTAAYGLADRILASGVVRDAATLADDETLIERVAFAVGAKEAKGVDRQSYWDIVLTDSTRAAYRDDAANALRALTAALARADR